MDWPRRFVESLPDAVITITGDGAVTHWNSGAERTFGFRASQAVGRRMDQLIIPERLRRPHRESIERVAGGGPARILDSWFETTAVTHSGGEFPVRCVVTQTSSDPVLYTGLLRDLSRQTAAERHRHALEAIEDEGSAGVALATTFGWWWRSGGFNRLHGLAPEASEGPLDAVLDAVHPRDRAQVADLLMDDSGSEGSVRYGAVLPDGSERLVRMRGVTAPDDTRAIVAEAVGPESAGASVLSAREIEVLQLAADGADAPEIARRLFLSHSTVKTHFENIYGKLEVSQRTAAVAIALRAGLID